MKLRNKKTGEIIDLYEGLVRDDGEHITIKPVAVLEKCYIYNSLAELNEDWEDYEEPKEYWTIDWSCTGVTSSKYSDDDIDDFNKSIGNYFDTREEAEKAVEKLKAWRRLKNKGLNFCAWKITDDGCSVDIETTLDAEVVRAQQKYITDDLNLLFGGEE